MIRAKSSVGGGLFNVRSCQRLSEADAPWRGPAVYRSTTTTMLAVLPNRRRKCLGDPHLLLLTGGEDALKILSPAHLRAIGFIFGCTEQKNTIVYKP